MEGMVGTFGSNLGAIQKPLGNVSDIVSDHENTVETVKELIGSNYYVDTDSCGDNVRNAIINEVFPTANDLTLRGSNALTSNSNDAIAPTVYWECHVNDGRISFHETVVFITGASNGIGLATAERCAQEGYIVIATARSPESRPQLLALAEQYQNLSVKKLDVTDSEEKIIELINSIGKIDILINNAGIGIVGAAESFSVAQIQQIFDTNVLGTMKVTNAVLEGMRVKNFGRIITISSIVGPLPDMIQWGYSMSKGALEHYTAHLKKDLAEANYNIIIANVHPGPVITNFETSATVGERFNGRENPYPQMEANVEKWRSLMREGRPVSETVDTILFAMREKNPPFWNATEPRVHNNFAETYCDPTGERFSKGPIFQQESGEFPIEVTVENPQFT